MKMSGLKRWMATSSAVAMAITSGGVAYAQAADAENVEAAGGQEIIVTAQKRGERIQDVPATILALGAEDLAAANVQNLEDVSVVTPGLNISVEQQKTQITIRGISAGSIVGVNEQPVATHVDGFFVVRSNVLGAQLLDVERVEVLKGPQGTLYGRNATAGAINIITNKPKDRFELLAAVESVLVESTGDGSKFGARGLLVANAPITDGIAARISAQYVDRPGSQTGIYADGREVNLHDERSYFVRGQLQFDLTDRLRWNLSADHYAGNDRGSQIIFIDQSRPDVPIYSGTLGFPICVRCRVTYLNRPVTNDPRATAVSSTFEYEATPEITLRLLSQYRYNRADQTGEYDSSFADIGSVDNDIRSKSWSHEFQAILSSGRLKGVVGVYYFREEVDVRQTYGLEPVAPGALAFLNGTGTTDAAAVFADLTYAVTDTIDATVGGRYSDERKSADQQASLEIGGVLISPATGPLPPKSFSSFTPKFVLAYKPSSNITAYASFSKGFKSGGFNIGALGDNTPFNPEEIDAYEAGLKLSTSDRGISADISAFHYDYTNLQLEDVLVTATVIRNAARARIRGVDFAGKWNPTDSLSINLLASYLDAKFTGGLLVDTLYPELGSQSLTGNRLTRAPRWTVTGGIRNTFDLGRDSSITPAAFVSYRSRQFFSPFNHDTVQQPGYATLRATIDYKIDDNWSLMVFGDNLTNKYAITSALISGGAYGFPLEASVTESRTFGLRLEFRM